MKLNLPGFCMFSLMLLSMISLQAQTTIEGEFRPRSEFRNGFRKPLADTLKPAFLTTQRTRLSAGYKTGGLTTMLTLQDARVFGASDVKSNVSKIEIFEAWADLVLTPGVSLQIGRQKLKYDDQRVFGESNWSNTGQSHDIALLKYTSKTFQAHLGYAYNNSKDTLLEINYSVSKMYKSMGFFWLSKDFGKGLSATAIGISEGLQNTDNYKKTFHRNTLGANLVLQNELSRFGFKASGYYQFGNSNANDTAKLIKNTTYADLSAYLLAIKATYKLNALLVLQGGIDRFSGTGSSTTNNKSYTFNRLYGTNHSFGGNMEFFVTLPKAGLNDYYAGVSYQTNKKLSFDFNLHFFSLDKDMSYSTKAKNGIVTKTDVKSFIGTETDLVVNYKLSKESVIQAGYSVFLNSASTKDYFKMENTATHTPQWVYLMFTIKPQFYKSPELKEK
jgi:Alginate export